MRKAKLFVIYFPVVLVALQVAANLLYFVQPDWYMKLGFYLNTFLGTNVLFSVFILIFTFMFRFCAVSRWAAVAECMFAFFYLVIQRDDVYNIIFQVGVGTLALIATFWHYIRKFPGCNFSAGISFISDVIRHRDCKKGLDHWDHKVRKSVLNSHHERNR